MLPTTHSHEAISSGRHSPRVVQTAESGVVGTWLPRRVRNIMRFDAGISNGEGLWCALPVLAIVPAAIKSGLVSRGHQE